MKKKTPIIKQKGWSPLLSISNNGKFITHRGRYGSYFLDGEIVNALDDVVLLPKETLHAAQELTITFSQMLNKGQSVNAIFVDKDGYRYSLGLRCFGRVMSALFSGKVAIKDEYITCWFEQVNYGGNYFISPVFEEKS